VLACEGTLVVFAFRNSPWCIVGSNGNMAGIPQPSLLLSILPLIFVLPFAVETLSGEGTASPEPEMTQMVARAGHHGTL